MYVHVQGTFVISKLVGEREYAADKTQRFHEEMVRELVTAETSCQIKMLVSKAE